MGKLEKMESSWEGAIQPCFRHHFQKVGLSEGVTARVSQSLSYAFAFCPGCRLHAYVFCWLPVLDFNNQAFDGALGINKHLSQYKDFRRFLTKASKISASPCILKLNEVHFLQSPAV